MHVRALACTYVCGEIPYFTDEGYCLQIFNVQEVKEFVTYFINSRDDRIWYITARQEMWCVGGARVGRRCGVWVGLGQAGDVVCDLFTCLHICCPVLRHTCCCQ